MAKPQKVDRREAAALVRNQQRSADRRRSLLIVGVCTVIAVLIIGAGVWAVLKPSWDQRGLAGVPLAELGEPAKACGEITTKDATGEQDHVSPGTPLELQDSPPAFGTHYDVWEPMERKFYSQADRPEIGRLIHNLEHGFTILWYDETAADDAETMATIREIADRFAGTDNQRLKFIAAPWLDGDGDSFPKGKHIALTHWSAGGVGLEATGQQVGVWQYCSGPSGAAVVDFMEKYPYMDSPEPGAV